MGIDKRKIQAYYTRKVTGYFTGYQYAHITTVNFKERGCTDESKNFVLPHF